MTTGMRGGDEGIPEGRADAEANECPKAICEQLQLSKLPPEYPNRSRILIRRQFLFEAPGIVNIAKGSLLQEIDLILR